jgi:hypothetical protein
VDVQLTAERKEDHRMRRGVSSQIDLRGRKKFGPLDPGPYELDLGLTTSVSLGGRGGTTLSTTPITLLPGKNLQTVQMPSLHQLAVIVEGMDPNSRIDLRQLSPDGSGFTGVQVNGARVGTGGRVVFERIPGGTYKLLTHGREPEGEMVVDVSGPSEVRFEPKPLNAMYVTVADPAGHLAGAGFKTGDLIVGLDGSPFVDQAQMNALLNGAAVKESARARVRRDGMEIDLPFDPRLLHRFKELGGNMWPSSR